MKYRSDATRGRLIALRAADAGSGSARHAAPAPSAIDRRSTARCPKRAGPGVKVAEQRDGFAVVGPACAALQSQPMTNDTEDGAEPRLRVVGRIRSELTARKNAPRQADEGAPDAWLDVEPWAADALLGIAAGDELFVITWLHEGRRDVMQVHPRGDPRNPIAGVFATRSPDRPNPLGLHPVTVRSIDGTRLRIGPIEAIDGTPVVDIKPVLPVPPASGSAVALPCGVRSPAS
jgi:tRNA-Thr(GGU) m(6)t(6)A37 methyltransferase TsaA